MAEPDVGRREAPAPKEDRLGVRLASLPEPATISPVGLDRAGLVPLQELAAAAAARSVSSQRPRASRRRPCRTGIEDHSTQAPLAVAQVDALAARLAGR